MDTSREAGVHASIKKRVHYSPPWADVSIIGIAGSSGSGKSTLSHAIVKQLNLPWVVILSMDSFYKSLNEEQSKKAFASEYDFDSPEVSNPRPPFPFPFPFPRPKGGQRLMATMSIGT